MSEDHKAYFPKHRDDEKFEKNLQQLSKHEKDIQFESERPDATFYGNNPMDQNTTGHHSSFDYKPAHNQDKYKHSQTTKNVPVYHDSIPVTHHHAQVAPAPDAVIKMYDEAEAQLMNEQAINDSKQINDSKKTSQHHEGNRRPSDPHAHEHVHIGHSDDPDIQQQLAHNRAMNVQAPTVIHSAEGDWCSSRCLVSSVFLVLAAGIIVV